MYEVLRMHSQSATEQPGGALAIFLQLFEAVGVVHRQHGDAVTDLDEPGNGLAADALRGAVWRDELGMVGFELLELRKKAIVFEVGDRGRGVDVVAAIMLADFVAESLHFVFNGFGHGHILQPIERADDAGARSPSVRSGDTAR